jgi:hypothetical protein
MHHQQGATVRGLPEERGVLTWSQQKEKWRKTGKDGAKSCGVGRNTVLGMVAEGRSGRFLLLMMRSDLKLLRRESRSGQEKYSALWWKIRSDLIAHEQMFNPILLLRS